MLDLLVTPDPEVLERARLYVDRGFDLITDHFVNTRDWMRIIDFGRLSIFDPHRCILAQVFGGYTSGTEQLGIEFPDSTVRYGFCTNSAHGLTDEVLIAAWRDKITGELTAA